MLFCRFSFGKCNCSLTKLFSGSAPIWKRGILLWKDCFWLCQTRVLFFGGNNQGMQLQANTQIDIHYIEMSDWSHFQYATYMYADMVVWYEFTCMCVCVCIFDEYPNVFMSVGMDGWICVCGIFSTHPAYTVHVCIMYMYTLFTYICMYKFVFVCMYCVYVDVYVYVYRYIYIQM